MMYNFEEDYLDLLSHILLKGEHRADRTGTGTTAVFAQNLRIPLQQGFPLLTTKKMGFKTILSELLWFIEGSGDERRLAEILHGTRDPSKKTIWSPNAEGTTGAAFQPAFPGDLGRVYGVQWRKWQHIKLNGYNDFLSHPLGVTTYFGAKVLVQEIDQLKQVVATLKTKPTYRRIILTAWNPGDLADMALPPCHMFAQFYLSNDKKLSCQMYQRSVDSFLGLPFNIASYALLTHMIAHVIGATADELVMCLGDTHIYNDHIEQVHEQLMRDRFVLPELKFNRTVTDIDDFKMEDFSIEGYQSGASIAAKMSA